MRLSPAITPTKYDRPSGEENMPIAVRKFKFDSVDKAKARQTHRVTVPDGRLICYHSDFGEVYIGNGHAHVGGAMYESNKMMFLRELVLDCLIELDDVGAIEGLIETDYIPVEDKREQ